MPNVKEKWITLGSGFGSGLVYGLLGKYWAKGTLPWALVSAIGGGFGATVTSGMTAEALEGVGSVGLGLVGASLPEWFAPPEEGETVGFIPAGKKMKVAGRRLLPRPSTSVAEKGLPPVLAVAEI